MSLDTRYKNAFALWLGDSPFNEDELDALRIRAWREQGVLITEINNEQLTAAEKVGLCRIGARLYGQDDETPDAA